MVYIESHQELGSHPKTRKLARLLGVSRVAVVGHLHYLWWWAMDYADDGDLGRFTDVDIAVGCEWEGDAGEFVAALIEAGFVDADRHIHDWHEYAGKLVTRRRANAARMREARAKDPGARATHVQRTFAARAERTELNGPELTKAAAAPPTPPTPNGSPPQPPIDSIHPTNGAAEPGRYEAELGPSMGKLAKAMTRLDRQLTEPWLRQTLREIEPRVGHLPRDRLMAGLDLAFDQLGKKHAASQVTSPRAFAAKLIADYLGEQAADVATQAGAEAAGRTP